jgi:hypothetical protein
MGWQLLVSCVGTEVRTLPSSYSIFTFQESPEPLATLIGELVFLLKLVIRAGENIYAKGSISTTPELERSSYFEAINDHYFNLFHLAESLGEILPPSALYPLALARTAPGYSIKTVFRLRFRQCSLVVLSGQEIVPRSRRLSRLVRNDRKHQ